MHRILHKLNSILYQGNLIIEKMYCLHVYTVFNAILVALLGLLGIILSLKKNTYHGVSFEQCYKIISNKDCNKSLKWLFRLLVLLPIANYCICELIIKSAIVWECILITIETVLLFSLIKPLFIVMICDEKYINNKIYDILKRKRQDTFEGIVETIETIIYNMLFVEHNEYQIVKKFVGNGKFDENSYFYLCQVLIKRLRTKTINDKKLVYEIVKDILKYKNEEELKFYQNNINYIAYIIYKLLSKQESLYAGEYLSQCFFLSGLKTKSKEYKSYICNLLIRAAVIGINQNDYSFLYIIKMGILKTFHNSYPIELIHIIDSYLYNIINSDSNIPQKLKNELIKFKTKADEFISWDKLVHSCKYYFNVDYDNLFNAYGISEINFTYEPPISKMITCTYDKIFRFNYYVYNRFNYDYSAGEFVLKMLKNHEYIKNNQWVLICLNELIDNLENNIEYVKMLLNEKYDSVIFTHNKNIIISELSNLNNNIEVSNEKLHLAIDVEKIKNFINNKYEKFNFFEKGIISNKILEVYNNVLYIDNDTLISNSNLIIDTIDSSIKSNLDNYIMELGRRNIKDKDTFISSYKIDDIAFADDWTIRSLYNDTKCEFQKLNLDILMYGRYIILKNFSIFVCLENAEISVIDENCIDDYIFQYRREDNLYYYNGKALLYKDIKDNILNKNIVYKIKYRYVFVCDKEKLNKVVLINE